jgi:hypothetical protein
MSIGRGGGHFNIRISQTSFVLLAENEDGGGDSAMFEYEDLTEAALARKEKVLRLYQQHQARQQQQQLGSTAVTSRNEKNYELRIKMCPCR